MDRETSFDYLTHSDLLNSARAAVAYLGWVYVMIIFDLLVLRF